MYPEIPGAQWHKATRSNDNGNCVGVASNLPGVVHVCDTKLGTASPVLTVPDAAWNTFTAALKAGHLAG